MRRSPESKSILSLYLVVFLLSFIIIFGIIEFRFLKNLLNSYGNSIEQMAANKTHFFLDNLKIISENAVRKIELQNMDPADAIRLISAYDDRISNVSLAETDGAIRNSLTDQGNRAFILESAFQNHIRVGVPSKDNKVFYIDFQIDRYQNEVIEEFANTRYKVAVFDSQNQPVIWPFPEEELKNFDPHQDKFYADHEPYHVVKNNIAQSPWQLYLFQQNNNFETIRTITIFFLVAALYYCVYQLLVELWRINSSKTYFDNIDFAIFNQLNEGVILTNNAGGIIFANTAAHEMFAERKSMMKHIENFQSEKDKKAVTLKISEKLLEVIHSPIIKKGKKLGSLSVIRVNTAEEQTFRNVLDQLIEMIPEGIIYVDKNNEIVTANLMAKVYLGSLDSGYSIEVIDSGLAECIHKNIDSKTINRMKLSSHDLWCDFAPVFDNDGVYIGTLIVLLLHDTQDVAD